MFILWIACVTRLTPCSRFTVLICSLYFWTQGDAVIFGFLFNFSIIHFSPSETFAKSSTRQHLEKAFGLGWVVSLHPYTHVPSTCWYPGTSHHGILYTDMVTIQYVINMLSTHQYHTFLLPQKCYSFQWRKLQDFFNKCNFYRVRGCAARIKQSYNL